MQFAIKLLGAKSKYDKTLPFTYYAVAYEEFAHREFEQQFFADIICGLVSYLKKIR